jgi:hypothetical protein
MHLKLRAERLRSYIQVSENCVGVSEEAAIKQFRLLTLVLPFYIIWRYTRE